MEKVATSLGQAVPVYSVDGDKNKKLMTELGVSSFPTLMLVRSTGVKKFEGERTFDQIVGFVCAHGLHGNYCPNGVAT